MSLPVMGCDPHLDTVTAAVVDANGGELMVVTVPNTRPGWDQLVAACFDYQVGVVGVEGASGYGRCLSQTLTGAGLQVREIPTRLTAATRRVDGAGKSDPGDARTIARAAARGEGSGWVDKPELETIRVLFNRRDMLVTTQTADINQLRALLVEVDPQAAAGLARLRSKSQFLTLAETRFDGDIHRQTVARLIRQVATDCAHRWEQIRSLERDIKQAMPPAGTALTNIQGAGTIVAAQLLAELAGSGGLDTPAKLAGWAGTAPLDASSGRQQRHRLNRGGNRGANRAIHTIVITQIQRGGKAADYVDRRTSEGKTRREAIRAAKRQITRHIWKILHAHDLT